MLDQVGGGHLSEHWGQIVHQLFLHSISSRFGIAPVRGVSPVSTRAGLHSRIPRLNALTPSRRPRTKPWKPEASFEISGCQKGGQNRRGLKLYGGPKIVSTLFTSA